MVKSFVEEGEVSEVCIVHSNCIEVAEDFKNQLVQENPELSNVGIYGLSPVIGAHLGTGTVGITFKRGRK